MGDKEDEKPAGRALSSFSLLLLQRLASGGGQSKSLIFDVFLIQLFHDQFVEHKREVMRTVLISLLVVSTGLAQIVPENGIDFDSVDINKDNQISFPEFKKYYVSHKGQKSDDDLLRLFRNYDTSSDGHLTIPEFVPLAYELTRTPQAQVESLFHTLDSNKDNVLTREELHQNKENLGSEIIEGLFLVADSNGDGRITHNEFKNIEGAFGQTTGSKKSENHGIARSLMENMDLNKDKKLSPKEVHTFVNQFNKVPLKTINAAFHKLDSNKDNFLTLSELQSLPEAITDLAGFKPMPIIN